MFEDKSESPFCLQLDARHLGWQGRGVRLPAPAGPFSSGMTASSSIPQQYRQPRQSRLCFGASLEWVFAY
jgi:hypothetical protein